MLTNPFNTHRRELAAVPQDYVPVTASATELGYTTLGLYIDGGGTVTVTTAAGESRTIPVITGMYLIGAFTHVTAFTCTAVFALRG